MSWQYDVHICNNTSCEVGAHDGPCSGWRRLTSFPGYEWAHAFLMADQLPHAQVIRLFTGAGPWGAGSVDGVFEHIAGGGLCVCGRGRGPLTRTYGSGPQFLCRACVQRYRAVTSPSLFTDRVEYPPVIDDAIADALRRNRPLSDETMVLIAEVTK